MSRRILAAAAMVGGLLVAAFAQSAAPVAWPPLYDGVVVVAPYVWLSPPPGLHGGARSDHETYPVSDGGFGAQTSEQPPQAEISVDFGSLQMPSGSKSVTITIRPVPGPGVAPSDGVLAGNVYRIEAVNQDGQAVEVKSGSQITILMRGPSSLLAAYIESYSNGQWTSLETDPVGVPDMYTALVGAFGDYAVVAADPNWQPIGEKARPATPVPAMQWARRRRRRIVRRRRRRLWFWQRPRREERADLKLPGCHGRKSALPSWEFWWSWQQASC